MVYKANSAPRLCESVYSVSKPGYSTTSDELKALDMLGHTVFSRSRVQRKARRKYVPPHLEYRDLPPNALYFFEEYRFLIAQSDETIIEKPRRRANY